MFDREDFQDLQKKRESRNGQTWNLEFLVQAQIHQQNLTGQPEWDRFLSYIQATVDRLEGERALLREAVCDPRVVDPNEVMGVKMGITRLSGLIEAFEAVLSLPKQIIETGEKAAESLKSIR